MNTGIEKTHKTASEAQDEQTGLMYSLWVLGIATLATVILIIPFVS